MADTKTNKTIKNIKPFEGFFDFIRSHGVISLAIGLFLGASLKTIVDSIVSNIVNPVVGVLSGNINLNNSYICIKSFHGSCSSKLGYGAVVSSVIEFLIAAFIVYLIIKVLKLDKFESKQKL